MRTHRRTGSWLALFALALQFVLAFDHVHVGDRHHEPLALAAIHGDHTGSAYQTGGDDHDPSHHPQRATQDFCAIYASLGLAAQSLLPVVATLLAPTDTSRPWSFAEQTASLSSSLYEHFRARAPPHFI